MPKHFREWLALLAFMVLGLGAAAPAHIFAAPAVESGWYATQLEKPAWTPPVWAFLPVWAALYGSMSLAAWLIWREKGLRGAPLAFFCYFFQLGVNAAWPYFFFGLKNPGAAFFEVLLLWLFVSVTAALFESARPRAGWVLLPYLLWVSFTVALNFQIWRLNG
ncbi:MAG: tryptophan-rich sensory protein [Planctomycetes bacterium]|nr:tryptophan-rich sensory protein [Planctomycetota bacterium]